MPAEPRLILIAERDGSVRDLQQHFLSRAGFRIAFADDGQSALDLARTGRPALVITEILIPKLDGLTLCRRLRDESATRHVPVIVFSFLAAASRAREAGASAFIRKPLIESTFIAMVHDAIAAPAPMEQQ